MNNHGIDLPKSEFMIFIIECASQRFFSGDKSSAYSALLESGIWSWYVDNYETTHTLGVEVLMDEVKEKLVAKRLLQ